MTAGGESNLCPDLVDFEQILTGTSLKRLERGTREGSIASGDFVNMNRR